MNINKIIKIIKEKRKKILIFLLFVIIVIILHKLIKLYEYKSTYEPILLKKSSNIILHRIDNSKIKKSNESIQFSYSFWLYIDNISGGEHWSDNYYTDKTIFKKGDSPIISYNPKNNILKVGIKTKTDNENVEVHILDNIKMQQWTHIVICIDNRNFDVYTNGKLYKSYKLNNVPILNDESVIIGSHSIMNGKIAYVRYFNTCLNRNRVNKVYKNSFPKKKDPSPSLFWWLTT